LPTTAASCRSSFLGPQRVQASGDDSLQRLGELERPAGPALGQHAGVLLRVERIAAGPGQERSLGLGREHRALEERAHEPGRVFVAEGRERECDGVGLASAPRGTVHEQLRPSAADEQEGNPGRPVAEMIDEVEQALVRPVQVLEDEDERAPVGESLEEAAPGGEALVEVSLPLSSGEAHEGSQGDSTHGRSSSSGRASSTVRASFSPAPSPASVSTPACALTISPRAQNVMPSPYGRERPCRQ
jgi:hypothetical protein